MEALGGYRSKSSKWKERTLKVFLSLAFCMGGLFLVQHKLIRSTKTEDFYSFDVLDAKGRTMSLEKYRGKVSTNVVTGSKVAITGHFLYRISIRHILRL